MTNHTAYITTKFTNETIRLDAGDTIKDFRGKEWVFQEVSQGPQPGRSAKIVVKDEIGTREFYYTVFPGVEVI